MRINLHKFTTIRPIDRLFTIGEMEEMPRPKFLDSKSGIQIFEETLRELWQAIKQYF